MAETLNIFRYATVIALIINFRFLIAEGRKMKSPIKQEVAAIKENSLKHITSEEGKNAMNVHLNNAAQDLAGKQDLAPHTSSFSTLAKDPNEFRPLTPYRGVGHPSVPEENVEDDTASKVSTTKSIINHFLTGQNDEFHPTQPGQSPGVGHVFRAESVEPKEYSNRQT